MKNIAATVGITSAVSAPLLTTTETQVRWSLGSFLNTLAASAVGALDIFVTPTSVYTYPGGSNAAAEIAGNDHTTASIIFAREEGTLKSRKLVVTLPPLTSAPVGDVMFNNINVENSLSPQHELLKELIKPVAPSFSLTSLTAKLEAFLDSTSDYGFIIDQLNETMTLFRLDESQPLAIAKIHSFDFIADVIEVDSVTGWE